MLCTLYAVLYTVRTSPYVVCTCECVLLFGTAAAKSGEFGKWWRYNEYCILHIVNMMCASVWRKLLLSLLCQNGFRSNLKWKESMSSANTRIGRRIQFYRAERISDFKLQMTSAAIMVIGKKECETERKNHRLFSISIYLFILFVFVWNELLLSY